jgi:hypothetical protein
METSTPPPIPPKIAASPPAKSFPRQAATFSLFAPLVAIAISVLGEAPARGNRWAMLILGLTATLLIVLGLVFGVLALIATKRHGRQGIFGRAIAGTIICGLLTLLMLISIPGLMRAAARAKEIQRQRMRQRQQ